MEFAVKLFCCVALVAGMIVFPAVSQSLSNAGSITEGVTPGEISPQGTTLGPVTYWVRSNTDQHVRKFTLDATDTININIGDLVVLSAKARCTGPPGSKGMLNLWDTSGNWVRQSVLLKPGKWGTLRSSTPLFYTGTGTFYYTFEACGPTGIAISRPVTVVVS